MAGPRVVLVETTMPARPAGRPHALVSEALEQRLCACANVGGRQASWYWWKGEIERVEEVLVSFKTTRARAAKLVAWLRANHPHEVPFIATVEATLGVSDYAKWLTAETRVTRTRRARRSR